ncbi:MAG TPA: invasion associated locus B family protein [Alphaproteobacteria bacterium]|nr:invasion associated locus B family protein [Alphaproteobacteria bacterium]
MKKIVALALALPCGLACGLYGISAYAQQKPPAPPQKTQAPQKATVIGTYGDWQALTYKQGTAETCYVASFPKKSEGHQVKLGDANILVTHWPSQKTYGVISVTGGFDYKKDSSVELVVGDEKFTLFTQGPRGWAQDGDDAKIVKALKGGKDAVAAGLTGTGTKTKDTYSLEGFTKAYEEASKACGVKG